MITFSFSNCRTNLSISHSFIFEDSGAFNCIRCISGRDKSTSLYLQFLKLNEMPNQKICCNPFKLRNHTWIRKGVAKAPSAFKEKFLELGKYVCIICRFHIFNNTIPSNKVSVSENDNNNEPFEEDPAEEPSSPDLPGRDKEYIEGNETWIWFIPTIKKIRNSFRN